MTLNTTATNQMPWELDDGEFLSNNPHFETSKPYRLWFEYLRISPSYWLAHKHITGANGGLKITDLDRQKLPTNFDDVIKTYNHFGDVYKHPFRVWWLNQGIHLFDKPKHSYSPKIVGKLEAKNSNSLEETVENLTRHFVTIKVVDGHPDCLLLSIPLNSNRADILKAISDQLSETVLNEHSEKQNNIYKLEGERFRFDTLAIGLRLLWVRFDNPDLAWWKVGQLAKISNTFPEFDFDESNQTEEQAEQKKSLASMTQKMFNKTITIVENAARGKFPSQAKIDPEHLKYAELIQRIQHQKRSDINFMKKIRAQIDAGHLMDLYLEYGDSFDFDIITYPSIKPN